MSDYISRAAAIDAINERGWLTQGAKEILVEVIEQLPTAQPEIIRCRDCKHSEHWYRDKCRCFLWHESGIDVFEDGFCNYAERRSDG